jgi:hypothetical protein
MPNGPKAIPNEKVRRFVECNISGKDTLARFIECSKGEVPIRDEGLVIGMAIGCPEELWRLPMIQSTIRQADFQNHNVGLLFGLLSNTINPSDLSPSLDRLLARRSRMLSWPTFYRVIALLHKRDLIHARDIFLPRLGLLSSVDLWCLAIMTFRVCDPSLLRDKHLMRIPRMRFARCRALLGILTADFTGDMEPCSAMFAEGMNELCGLGKDEHSRAVLLIAHYCLAEGGRLASAVVREMAVRKDCRDLDIVRAAVQASSLKAIKK